MVGDILDRRHLIVVREQCRVALLGQPSHLGRPLGIRFEAGVADDLERIFAKLPRLKERIGQVAGTLSGGEQQMLAIARSLMSRPRLMLFDEPSLGLAPNLVERVFEIIAEIRREGTTVLMVEQNALAALEMCDRAYLLETGQMVLAGAGRDLLENPHVRRAYLGG